MCHVRYQNGKKQMQNAKTFLTEWESLYFFVEHNGKPFSLICQVSLEHFKVSNLQCHFSSLHGNINREFSKRTELRKNKLITLKSEAEKQKQLFQKFMKHSETVMLHRIKWLGTLHGPKSHKMTGNSFKNASVTLLKSCLQKTTN